MYFQVKGMVITPPDDKEWKTQDGDLMFMTTSQVVAGQVVVKVKQFGDNAKDFIPLAVGQMITVDVKSAKTEKGAIEVGGEITIG